MECYYCHCYQREVHIRELHRKIYRTELKKGGRDYRFAIKIPVFMQEFGLHDVGVRMNDSVKFINPNEDKDKYIKQFNAMVAAWGWDKELSEEDKLSCIKGLMERGLNKQETERYLNGELKISEHLMENKDNVYVIQEPCTLISYGIK